MVIKCTLFLVEKKEKDQFKVHYKWSNLDLSYVSVICQWSDANSLLIILSGANHIRWVKSKTNFHMFCL